MTLGGVVSLLVVYHTWAMCKTLGHMPLVVCAESKLAPWILPDRLFVPAYIRLEQLYLPKYEEIKLLIGGSMSEMHVGC